MSSRSRYTTEEREAFKLGYFHGYLDWEKDVSSLRHGSPREQYWHGYRNGQEQRQRDRLPSSNSTAAAQGLCIAGRYPDCETKRE